MKKVISLFLVLLMFIVMVAACGDSGINEKSEDTTAADTSADTAPAEETTTRQPLTVPKIDYGGVPFRILTQMTTVTGNSSSQSHFYYSEYISVPDRIGEPINDAVYARNLKISEDYGVEIIATELMTYSLYDNVRKFIMANDDVYDIVTAYTDETFRLAQEKLLINLYTVPYLDLSNPWWDRVFVEKLSLSNKLYTITGDINIEEEELNWCLIANKTILEQSTADNVYQIVKDGKWTMDYVHRLGVDVTRDINGDGIIDYNDIYAFANSYAGCHYFYSASGENIAVLDKDGYPQLNIISERSVSVMDKITEFYNDRNFMIWADDYYGVIPDPWEEFRVMFRDNRLMIFMTNIYALKELRNMVDDFAVLPPPKYDEIQDKYYAVVATHACGTVSVPVTNSNLERTGVILEAMAYHSKGIQEAHMDINITGKFLRDEESREMLQIIFDNRTYDIGKTFNWGSYVSQMCTAVKDKKPFASLAEAKRSKAEKEIAKSYALFSELD